MQLAYECRCLCPEGGIQDVSAGKCRVQRVAVGTGVHVHALPRGGEVHVSVSACEARGLWVCEFKDLQSPEGAICPVSAGKSRGEAEAVNTGIQVSAQARQLLRSFKCTCLQVRSMVVG